MTVIPIFFQVSPLDIYLKLCKKYAYVQNETLEMVTKWLYAQVSRKPSFHSNDWEDDSELVDKITSLVSHLISSTSSYHSSELSSASSLKIKSALGLGRDIVFRSLCTGYIPSTPNLFEDVNQLFLERYLAKRRSEILHTESTLIGINGMEGVGKTTLTRHVYKEISPRFQHHMYITNKVIGRCKRPFILREMLHSEILKANSIHMSSDNDIKEMIGHRKVLLVADGVDDIKQLKDIIIYANWFGPGSRVIVITQDKSLLTQCGVKEIYEVECPEYNEALAFFSEFDFKQSNPHPGFEDLSSLAVHLANRLPLALKVLGSFLHDRNKDEWVSTLRRLEASRDNYASEVNRSIGADDYAPRRPIKVDRHIGVDEANCFPLYCLALE